MHEFVNVGHTLDELECLRILGVHGLARREPEVDVFFVVLAQLMIYIVS